MSGYVWTEPEIHKFFTTMQFSTRPLEKCTFGARVPHAIVYFLQDS